MSVSATVTSNTQQAPKPFVAPAHPQSHHLHSLPPREKTTRTLILDHTAWRHGRTRLAQGRCELGMNDDEDFRVMAYGKKSKRQHNGSRPRSVPGDGMDVDSDGDSSHYDSEDHHQGDDIDSEDGSVALSLSSRAVGMEKVLDAMLVQAPSTPPRHQNHFSQQPTSVSSETTRILPNGLRLRLALLTVVNDLFERQASSTVERPPLPAVTTPAGKTSDSKAPLLSTPLSSLPSLPPPSLPTNAIPPGLAVFLQISNQPHYIPPTLPSFHTLSLPSSPAAGPVKGFPARSTQAPAPSVPRDKPAVFSPWGTPSMDRPGPSTEKAAGSVSNFPSSWKDARYHLSHTVKPGGILTRRAAGRAKDIYAAGCYEAPVITNAVLIDLLPRFLRLSALVAMELGREARGEEPEANEGKEDAQTDPHLSTPSNSGAAKASPHALPTRAWFALLCGLITRGVLEGYVARGWKGSEYVEVLMGIGLGIKGVGTRPDGAGFGNGNAPPPEIPTIEDSKNEFEPDEMLGLIDSCKVLFNDLLQGATSTKDAKDETIREPEREYVREMEERMSEFLNVPHNCPDLATHLTQLSEKYPAKPVERAALRFCEAVAKWRGKPELEMVRIRSILFYISPTQFYSAV
ncbi:hypothetical protein BU17DRAFT_49530 [Hysterangium stoloniferum]|nr:hypothetical protein BU17DRAFT_49530 [Hysterangium stoloniferum]